MIFFLPVLIASLIVIFFIVRYCNAVADPQSLLEEKEALQEKLALSEYELRLAQEDILKLRTELQKKTESPPINVLSGKLTNLCGL